MKLPLTLNERGDLNVLLIPLILVSLLFFGALGFGTWAYMEREDYKNNSDQKVTAAVQVAEDRVSTQKDNEFLEREKEPLRDYESPAVLGSIKFSYPKTWSGYESIQDDKMSLLMDPGLVPGGQRSIHALRVEVETNSYDAAIKRMDSAVKSGEVNASAFRLEQLPDVLGTKFDGEIDRGVRGSMVVLPLRDKTITVSTESEEYLKDFENIILKNFTFSP